MGLGVIEGLTEKLFSLGYTSRHWLSALDRLFKASQFILKFSFLYSIIGRADKEPIPQLRQASTLAAIFEPTNSIESEMKIAQFILSLIVLMTYSCSSKSRCQNREIKNSMTLLRNCLRKVPFKQIDPNLINCLRTVPFKQMGSIILNKTSELFFQEILFKRN